MIIGISGYIGSGKDTVAQMIQYLSDWKRLGFPSDKHIQPWLSSGKERYDNPTWEIKKFAGKLKEICSLLTGIPISQFEQQSVKDSFLGPEWDQIMIVDSFTGTYPEFTKVCEDSNIQPILESPVRINQYDYMYKYFHKVKKMKVRELLQKMGTDAMRDKVHPNIHINALFTDYKPSFHSQAVSKAFGDPEILPKWIISDLRFPNEFQAIKDRGGVCIRINRPSQELPVDSITGKKLMDYPRHESETALDNAEFDAIIGNNDSLEILLKNVQATLYTLNLFK